MGFGILPSSCQALPFVRIPEDTKKYIQIHDGFGFSWLIQDKGKGEVLARTIYAWIIHDNLQKSI